MDWSLWSVKSKWTNSNVNKEIGIETSMLISDLCDFSDACIVVKGATAVADPNDAKRKKSVSCKNNAPLINWIWKISCVKIDNAEDLDVVNANAQFAWVQQKLQKNKRKFVELLQRWTK